MISYDIKLSDTVTGLTNTSWDPDNIVSGRAVTEDQLDIATSQLPFIVRGGTADNVEVASKTRKNLQFDVNNLPSEYVIGAYRQVSILNASNGGVGYQEVFLHSFSTTGNGTKANISIFNAGENTAKVKVDVNAICLIQT